MVFAYQYETATGVAGESETLDPVLVTSDDRAGANCAMYEYVAAHGGRFVHCESCSDVPLLDGEDICADCVSFAKAIVLTPAMKYALSIMVDNGGDARFEFEREQDGADDCVSNDLAVGLNAKGYEITWFGRAVYAHATAGFTPEDAEAPTLRTGEART